VNDALAVRRRKTAAGRAQCLDDVAPRVLLLAVPRERLAFDVLHRDPDALQRSPHVVDRHHVWMGQPGKRLRLAEQPLAEHPFVLLRFVGAKQLDRDTPVQLRVVAEEHLTHAARAELLEHGVATQLLADQARRGAHVGGNDASFRVEVVRAYRARGHLVFEAGVVVAHRLAGS